MAFADSIRTQLASMEGVATLLEALLISGVEVGGVLSPQNITATSATAITGATTSVAVASGENVLVLGCVSASNGTSGKYTSMVIHRDTTAISQISRITAAANNSTGLQFNLVAYAVDAPSAGTYAYNLKGYTQSSGSAYFYTYQLIALKYRVS